MKAINNLDPRSADNLRSFLAEVNGQTTHSILDLLNIRRTSDVPEEKNLA